MPKLNFIKDDDLELIVRDLLAEAVKAKAKAEQSYNRNVIDPFAVLFEMAGFDLDPGAWLTSEKTRQAQKTLQNHVGEFHQRVLGKVSTWQDLGVGSVVDLVSAERRVIAEIKNKHNTVKGSDRVGIYDTMHSLVMPKGQIYRGYTAYYVEVIPKTPARYDVEFTPPDKTTGEKRIASKRIRLIDGASFYALATGVHDALPQLFSVLPEVIESCSGYTFIDRDFLSDFFKSAYGE
jgi:hypothetical protein